MYELTSVTCRGPKRYICAHACTCDMGRRNSKLLTGLYEAWVGVGKGK